MRAVLRDLAEPSLGEKLRANNQISANRRVGRLLHIGLGRARLTGLFECGLVVDGDNAFAVFSRPLVVDFNDLRILQD
jgi:hypothetical protein